MSEPVKKITKAKKRKRSNEIILRIFPDVDKKR